MKLTLASPGKEKNTHRINELRLPMNDPRAQQQWDSHIREFLNLGH